MESAEQRAVRRRRRTAFGQIAERYDRYRPGYPAGLADALVATARLGPGGSVLEIGCGTGQLTGLLRDRGLRVTALDVSAPMIAVARQRVTGAGVSFQVSSFEEFPAEAASYDLVVSADAFHWVDPEVRYTKTQDALRPGGWLAVIACDDSYDEPLQGVVERMWIARSEHGSAWLRTPKPTVADEMRASGRFGAVVEAVREWRLTRSPDEVVGLETTRATALGWGPDGARQFARELRARIGDVRVVQLTRRAHLAMAERPATPAGG